MIRDVEYGHAEYVRYNKQPICYRYATKHLVNSENWSLY